MSGKKRKLEELNLLDDFLFGKMLSYPGIGEQFARELLRIIFNRSFDRLTVVPQKVYYGSDMDKHGARLDVYLEEMPLDQNLSGVATVYDMEPDQREEERQSLPKRTRFYHAMIDAGCLEAGQSYKFLKNVIVIMIVPFDPFGWDHMIYTIRNKCEELPDMLYEDGARTLFLYTRGKKGKFSQELCDLLTYMEHTNEENAKTEALQNIQKMVRQVKMDRGVSLEYMKIFEREEMIRNEGIEQGRQLERENTEREREKAEREREKAEQERLRADAAEKEAEALRLELARLTQSDRA